VAPYSGESRFFRPSLCGRQREDSAIDIYKLLDQLEALVDKSKRIPVTDNRLVNDRTFFDLTNQIRSSLPVEIESARETMRRAETIAENAAREAARKIEEAREQTERILTEARAAAEEMVSEHEITLQAQSRANDLVEAARSEGQEIRSGADAYALEVLNRIETMTAKIMSAVEAGRGQLRPGG